MTSSSSTALTDYEFDKIAWSFLGSQYAGKTYADWTIDRRVDGYLLHLGRADLLDDGSAYNALLEHVMANLGRALRDGILPSA
jgi:hypothetical protein